MLVQLAFWPAQRARKGTLTRAAPADRSSFWGAAVRGDNLQRVVPFERWDIDVGYSPSTAPQGMTIYVRFGAFCSGMLRGSNRQDSSSCGLHPPSRRIANHHGPTQSGTLT